MDNRFYVYELRLEGSVMPFYIGKGSGDRYKRHLTKTSLKAKNFKNNVIKKALKNGTEVLQTKLCVGLTSEEAYQLEEYLITKIGRRNLGTGPLTNLSDGGSGPNGMKVTRTAEHNEKIGLANKGRLISEDWKKKISDSNKGKIVSDETRKRLSEASAKQERVKCSHCGIVTNLIMSKRYHEDNCIERPGADVVALKLARKSPKISGEKFKNSKFTENDIREIRRLVEVEGMTKAAVSRIYNTTDGYICQIVARKSWAHVL